MTSNLYNDEYFASISEGWNKMSYGRISDEIGNDTRLGSNGNVVLDVGCGTGLYSSVLMKNGNCYLGIDVSNSALKNARKKGVNAIAGNAENIPLESQSVDYVFSTEVIEHVAEPEQMMKEISRVLKPGGCGLITTTTYQFLIFHYIWVLSEISFHFRDIVKYPLGFFSKKHRDQFVRLLYNFTGGHLWGFMKKDLIRLVEQSSLEVEDIYYLNVQPIIPLKLKGGGFRKIVKKLVDLINGIFLNRKRAIYGPNIIIKFRRPGQLLP